MAKPEKRPPTAHVGSMSQYVRGIRRNRRKNQKKTLIGIAKPKPPKNASGKKRMKNGGGTWIPSDQRHRKIRGALVYSLTPFALRSDLRRSTFSR